MAKAAARTEARLKELLREPANKRCIDCESLGPQYVVSNFNVFVCTVCSGVHRQFGHRVKGVSMSTFKPEEVQALAESGNAKFAAFYLSKWQPGAAPKPVDRDVHRIHAWIAAAYQDKRWFAEPAGGWTPGAAAAARAPAGTSSSTEGHEPAVRPLSEVLGGEAPRLQVQGSPSGHLERSISAVSSSAGAGTPKNGAAAAAARPVNLLDAGSPKPAAAATAAAPAWDPFGEAAAPAAAPSSSPAAAAAAKASPRAAQPAAEAGWAAFGDAPASPAAAAPAAAAPAPASPGAGGSGGWEAFGDGPSSPGAAAAAAAASAAPPPAAAPAPAAAVGTAPSSAGSSPPKAPAPVSRQPVASSARAEVPMDVFYPEFEQIRATGMLPTGRPVPLPPFPPSYAGGAPGHVAAHPHAVQHPHAYAAHPAAAAAAANPYAAAPGYGAPQRPTIAIPPAPLHPGYHPAYAASPAGGHPAYSPGTYSSSAYSPAGSAISPQGSGYSSAVSQPANGGFGGSFTGLEHPGAAALRGSVGEALPPGVAPTPGAQHPHRLGEPAPNDPFASLAPGFRSALPVAPQAGSFKAGGAAPPPPTPAGGPPFAAPPPAANGNGAAFPAAGPFAGAPSPAAGLAPAAAAATATLFGTAPSLTGYDLSAPAAPKPQASGNPFA